MDTRLNWYALQIAIELTLPAEKAFDRLYDIKYHKVTKEEVADMKKLKKEHTYPELSEIFGMSQYSICGYVKGRLNPSL